METAQLIRFEAARAVGRKALRGAPKAPSAMSLDQRGVSLRTQMATIGCMAVAGGHTANADALEGLMADLTVDMQLLNHGALVKRLESYYRPALMRAAGSISTGGADGATVQGP